MTKCRNPVILIMCEGMQEVYPKITDMEIQFGAKRRIISWQNT